MSLIVTAPAQYQETTAQKFRRLLAKADVQNALTSAPLVGATAWSASTVFYPNNIVSNNSGAYICTIGGTSASSGGPSGRGLNQQDGSVYWDYIGPQTAPQISQLTSCPAYLQNNSTSQLKWNDARIRVLGCKNPYTFSSQNMQYPTCNAGPGGTGIAIIQRGANAGSPLINGQGGTHFGLQICTDAPVICFQMNGSGNWPCNFIVEQDGVKQYVSPSPIPANGHSYWVLDFTQTTNVNSTNGAQVPPGSMNGTTLTAVLTGTSITSVTSSTGFPCGSGWSQSNLPTIEISGGTSAGTPARLTPVINAAGQISSITIQSAGNYQSPPTLLVQPGRAKRIITLESGETNYLTNIFVGSFDTVWPIPMTDRIRVASLGDSWTEGFVQSTNTRRLAQNECFAHLMGWDDCIAAGAGGTDYLVPMVPFTATVTSGAISPGSQTVTLSTINATLQGIPNAGANNFALTPGTFLTFDTGAGMETVQLAAVNTGAGTVTATFANSHSAGCVITGYLNYLQCGTTVTSGAISTGSQSVTLATINNPKGNAAVANTNVILVDALGTNPELVTVSGLSGSTFTATFAFTHPANAVCICMSTSWNINHNLRVGDIAFANSATFTAKTGNTGNGTCSAITVSPSRVPGNYTFVATSATNFTAIDGTGATLPAMTVGTPYSASGISFTITAGGTPYVAGDTLWIYVIASPDIITIGPTGINDSGSTGNSTLTAQIQAECVKIYNNIRAILPNVPIIWFGCNGGAGSGATWPPTAIEQGIANAIAGFNDPLVLFVPVQLDSNAWLNTNYGTYFNPAQGHPTDQGFLYMATRMANQIVRQFIQNATWQ